MRTLSIAVIALIGSAAAHRHHHHHRHPHHKYNVQFVDQADDEDFTTQSIAESEKEHGAKMAVLDDDHYKQAIRADNKLKFTGDEF